MTNEHVTENEMVQNFDDVVELGKEMEQISKQNSEMYEEKQLEEQDNIDEK
ncbi:SAS053 family DNA gyrase inhibitor [Macrococcus sp. DPC7161]|uniref:SAS053 family DNA gyrase inhibitor n=1 Tax=Macrococcus sp. DPC7161 TaxID=2507060 RepID=UPI0013E8FB0A|nr:SAS053 family protein [Macrococcus sp. DPC7161]